MHQITSEVRHFSQHSLTGFLSDLFATSQNAKCCQYYSRAGIGWGSLGDAFLLYWGDSLLYTFPPTVLIPRILDKIKLDSATLILIAPAWAQQTWYPFLHRMSLQPLYTLPNLPDLLYQDYGCLLHPPPHTVHLMAWLLTGSTHLRIFA